MHIFKAFALSEWPLVTMQQKCVFVIILSNYFKLWHHCQLEWIWFWLAIRYACKLSQGPWLNTSCYFSRHFIHRFPGHTKTTILRIWLISFRSWSSRIFRLPSITVFMLVILSWTVEKPSLHSRFRRANSSFCVAAICSRRATILFSKCWIKNFIKSFFEYRSFLTF